MEIRKLVNKATELMFNYPNISVMQQIKNIMKKCLGKNVYVPNCIGWPNGLCALGIIEYIKANPDSGICRQDVKNLKSYFDKWIRAGMEISRVEDFISGYVLMELMDVMASKNEPLCEEYENAVHKMYEYLRNARTDEQGIFVYVPNLEENYVFADMIGMVCPFLAKYGAKYNDMKAIELCMKQFELFVVNSTDSVSKLPYHVYEYHNDNKIDKLGLLAWGRAVGWLLLGLYGARKALLSDGQKYSNEIELLTEKLIEYGIILKEYQREDGLFGWSIMDAAGPSDTSATAMILYSLSSLRDNQKIDNIFSRAVPGLLSYVTADGNVMQGQAECLGIGIHPMKFGSYPWTVGPALALFSITKNV